MADKSIDGYWDAKSGDAISISDLITGKALRVLSIASTEGDEGFGLWYEVVAKETPRQGHGRATKEPGDTLWTHHWWIAGWDDLGTHYEGTSGAQTVLPDGTVRGVLDIFPSPPQQANWLNLTLLSDEDAGGANTRRFVLRVALPLPLQSIESIMELGQMDESERWAVQRLAEFINGEATDRSRL